MSPASSLFRRAPRWALALPLAILLATPPSAGAQSPRPAQRNVAKLVFDGGVIAVDARADERLVVGAAVGDSTLIVPIPIGRARDWANAVAAILARRVPASRTPRQYRSLLVDPDSGAGVSLTRHVLRGRSTYRLFFANTSFGGFPLDVSRREAMLLVRAVRRGVVVSRAMARVAADSVRR